MYHEVDFFVMAPCMRTGAVGGDLLAAAHEVPKHG